jgi:cobalt-precorrin 5A hydrolase
MGGDKMKIAIGVGCRKGCPSEAIVALVKRAMARAACEAAPVGLFSHAAKRFEPGLVEAAEKLGLPLILLDQTRLRAASPHAATTSTKVMTLFALPSIAETAALAGAGARAELLVSRISSAGASCAIARTRSGEGEAVSEGRNP